MMRNDVSRTLRSSILNMRNLLTPGRNGRRISLSSAPYYISILVIFGLTLFIGVFWMVNEYQAYVESITNIRNNYQIRYRNRVQEEHGKVIDFIEYKRSLANARIEDEVRDKVQSAYTLASHTYQLYKNTKSVEEVRSMVAELLRPIRWSNGRGYYFAGTVTDGRIDLFADEPWFEGKTAAEFAAISEDDAIGDIIDTVREKGAGVYSYKLRKPQFAEERFAKIAAVKYFAPFDWFIGAGIYTEAMEKNLQEEILSRIQSMHFARDGNVLGFRQDGTVICSQDKRLVGRSVASFVDADRVPFGQKFLVAAQADQGGFVSYSKVSTAGKVHLHLSYVKPYRDWGWVFRTSMSMDEMERVISHETQSYSDIAFKNVSIFMLLFVIAVSVLLLISYFYSLKIRHGINLFTDFLRQATDSKKKIKNNDLAFTEFEELRILANRMVDDRIQKEILLHRDELRLDTLLQLGMMGKQSLQKKYDFLLQRIVQITRSQMGYLALVNEAQTHISLCSEVTDTNKTPGHQVLDQNISRSLGDSGLVGAAVISGHVVNCNGCKICDSVNRRYPYTADISRHLDVPVSNNGKIVLVAGVSNNQCEYDNSDVRQMKMLLEGMWLHVVQTCSEQEMARLERQIIAVSEEERSNIGRDLHDDLGSHLTGVELLSKVLQQKLEKSSPALATQLTTIRDLIRDAIDKTRRLAQGLYPAHIIEYGLEAAIEELVHEVEDLFRVQCSYSFEGARDWADAAVATHVYYIIREAAFNAARHGKPDNIGIFMRIDKESFAVRVVDDGSGFDEESTRKGLGCHTMKYRAKAIGAELQINSEVDAGTIVSLAGEVHN